MLKLSYFPQALAPPWSQIILTSNVHQKA